MDISLQFLGDSALRNSILSLFMIATVLVLRSFFLRGVQRAEWSSENLLLRWTVQVRRASVLIILLGLIVIWASELRTLAISVVAIAAAIVLALKELIMCLSGSIVRTTSNAYSVGDRIEIEGVRGDVVDIGGLTTTVLEIGPGHRRTGRAVTIPNSVLLTKSVVNETYTDAFVLHVISIPLAPGQGWRDAERRLLKAANVAVEPFLNDARHHIDATARRHGVPAFSIAPSVSIQVGDAGTLSLALRLPARAEHRSALEQQVLRGYLDEPAPETAATVPTS